MSKSVPNTRASRDGTGVGVSLLNLLGFRGRGSRSKLHLAVSLPLVPMIFEILPCGLPAQAILCPYSNDSSSSHQAPMSQMTAAQQHGTQCPPEAQRGDQWAMLSGSQSDTGIWACLQSHHPP